MTATRATYQKTIWMYWETPPGGSRPVYLDLCLEIIKKRQGSFSLKLLDEQSVTNYIDLPKNIRHPALPLDRKADYIRYDCSISMAACGWTAISFYGEVWMKLLSLIWSRRALSYSRENVNRGGACPYQRDGFRSAW